MDCFHDDIILYHGSHYGINGKISLDRSRTSCDFGTGFYAGDKKQQAKGLIATDTSGVLYELKVDLAGLNVYHFTDNVLWALYVGYNRGKIEITKYPKLEQLCKDIDGHDVIIGLIADDRMAQVYSNFLNNFYTDKVLIDCLSYVKHGNQYVFKTVKACNHIKILKQCHLEENEKLKYYRKIMTQRKEFNTAIERIRLKYLHDGLFAQEILETYR